MFSAGRVLLMPKGAYNPLTTYEMLDIVSYNGSSYIAKGTTTGNLPTDTTYWQLSAYGGQAANIAGNFAELESSSVATAIHYVDDIFVDENSQLMKATQTINIGDTIDANVNCAPTTVEALIAYLSSYVDSLDSLNKKIQGAIEIAAQTDLHSLAIGEYYKKQSTFYVTNGPTGIDQDPTAIFRLTVEAALDNASQASSPLLLTLRTPDGKIYTQGFDGTSWGSWEQIAVESSVADVDTRVDSVESSVADVETSSTASKSYAVGESFYYNDVLLKATSPIPQGGTITPGTNCTPEKIIEKIDDLVSENQTLTQYANSQRNPNLLDNPFFTVNQRGTAKGVSITTTAIDKYLDRWWINTGRTFTYNSNESITSADLDLWQILDAPFDIAHLAGKTVTASVMYSDGTIESGSHTIRNSVPSENVFTQVSGNTSKGINLIIGELSSGLLQVSVMNHDNISATIKAVKLELGTVSTLAHDSEPDYAIELAKCRTSTADGNSDAYANQGQINVGTPNPNLLDNPWFTVNQRGFTSTNTAGYTVDRWQLSWNPGNITVSLGNNGITLDATNSTDALGYFAQFIDNLDIVGKVVTASVLLADGTIKTGTGVMPTKGSIGPYIITGEFNLYLQYNSNNDTPRLYISIGEGHSVTIRAVKLELGTVSTLAHDTAPNYATELLKCQRYFVRISGNTDGGLTQYGQSLNGYGLQASSARVMLPKSMRARPYITYSSLSDFKLIYNGKSVIPTNIQLSAQLNNFINVHVDITDTDLQYHPCCLRFDNSNAYIDFSADL